MRHTAARLFIVFAALLMWVNGCAEKSTGPVRTPVTGNLPTLIVSEPFQAATVGAASANASGASSQVSDSVVYVSLPPGSVPGGLQATIRDQASGRTVNAFFVNDGFDPVALAASVGDTLLVEITLTGSPDRIHVLGVVRKYRPPVVVRTNPPPGQVDVPLNSIMLVVFSVPIDSATLNVGTVQLWRDTTQLAGTMRFSDAARIKAEFHPDSGLASGTTYRLVISQGIGDANGLKLESPVTVQFTTGGTGPAGGLGFIALSAGANHTCGLTTGGAAYCWGDNTHGTLGNGTTTSSPTPVRVAGGLAFTQIRAGWVHTCGVTTAGDAYCWGNNDDGQLGDGTTVQRTSPVLVAGGHSFFVDQFCTLVGQCGVSVGGTHTCGVTPETFDVSAVTYCWGSNASGQIGNASNATATTPTVVPDVWGQFLSAGRNHTCLLDVFDVGLGWCWGANDRSQLDDGTTIGSATPVPISLVPCMSGGLSGFCPFEAISSGESHSCAEAGGFLYLSYSWYCWGANDHGQLGDGTTIDRTGPLLAVGARPVGPLVSDGIPFAPAGVSAGGQHTCGVTSAGVAYCWGLNSSGQLGDGTTTQRTRPALVAGGLSFLAVSAGKESHSCGVTARGDAYCWGSNNYGQLGNGTTTGSSVPVRVVVKR